MIDEAIARVDWSRCPDKWEKLERYLNLDGYAFVKETTTRPWGDKEVKVTGLVASLPAVAELPESLNEMQTLLKTRGFDVAIRHFNSAQENFAQGDWEASNSQCRTFLEAITDGIADTLYPVEAASFSGGLQKRQLLANKGFLSRAKHEFNDGGRPAFLPGLAKLLHPDGAHPGKSTRNDALFRLQSVVVTGSWLMRRLEDQLQSQAS